MAELDLDNACDECGPAVRAYVFVDLPSGRTLSYCAHHGAIHKERLLAIGAEVHDFSDMVGSL